MKERVKKSLLISLMFVLAFSGWLVGCSSDADDKNTVTFWHALTGKDKEAIETIVKKFEKKSPKIKVKIVYVARQGEGQNDKLLAAVAGGRPPDVAYFDRFEIGSWAAQGSLTDLTDRVKKDNYDLKQYYPFAIEEATYKGRIYGLPFDTDSRLLFYNKELFKKAGIKEPPKTIVELEEVAEKLTVKEGNRYKQIGFVPWYSQGWLYTWGWAFGGDFYDPKTGKVTANHPKVVEALQWEADFAKKFDIQNITAFTDAAGTANIDPFAAGKFAMMVDGPFRVPNIEKFNPNLDYGVAPIPTPTGKNHATWSGGWSFVIPKGAKNVDGAWEFIKYAAGPEGQRIYTEKTGNFAAIDSINQELYANDPIFGEFLKALPTAHHRPVIPQGSLLWNELAKAVDAAIRGKGKPQDLLNQVTDKVNRELEKNK